MSYGDEYYCPNCGATLNDQYGFDPDKGSWTCIECGQHLMDDDIYDGDTFEGVEWRCDCCNALLNRQYGFSDSLGSWTCTECGHTNGITEDDIIDESDIIRCPNCDGVLNKQFGFNEYDNDCECSFCGAKLHRDYTCDDFSVVEDEESSDEEDKFECPSCGDELNDQWGFNKYDDDWTCSSCGTKLYHDYCDDGYEILEAEEIKKTTTHYSSAFRPSTSATYSPSHTSNTRKSSNNSPAHSVQQASARKKDSSWIAIIVCFVIALSIPFGMMLKFEIEEKNALSEGKINAGYYEDLIGEDYKTVEAHFRSAGFTNIELIDLNDSGILFWKDGKVETISIAGNTTFESTDWFDPNCKVVISYH